MWMHFVEPIRCSSPPRGSGGTATRPRVSSAAAVWRGYSKRSRKRTAADASAASASPTRMVMVATLLESVPAKSRGAPAASASATDGQAASGW